MKTKNGVIYYVEKVAIPLIDKVKKQLDILDDCVDSNITTREQIHGQINLIRSTLPDTDMMITKKK